MRNAIHGLIGAVLAAGLLAAAPAVACDLSDEYRQMNGTVASIDGGKLVLAQRGGAEVPFRKAGGVEVMGERRSWGAIAKGDRAIVAWDISDSPAIAHQVCVLPGS